MTSCPGLSELLEELSLIGVQQKATRQKKVSTKKPTVKKKKPSTVFNREETVNIIDDKLSILNFEIGEIEEEIKSVKVIQQRMLEFQRSPGEVESYNENELSFFFPDSNPTMRPIDRADQQALAYRREVTDLTNKLSLKKKERTGLKQRKTKILNEMFTNEAGILVNKAKKAVKDNDSEAAAKISQDIVDLLGDLQDFTSATSKKLQEMLTDLYMDLSDVEQQQLQVNTLTPQPKAAASAAAVRLPVTTLVPRQVPQQPPQSAAKKPKTSTVDNVKDINDKIFLLAFELEEIEQKIDELQKNRDSSDEKKLTELRERRSQKEKELFNLTAGSVEAKNEDYDSGEETEIEDPKTTAAVLESMDIEPPSAADAARTGYEAQQTRNERYKRFNQNRLRRRQRRRKNAGFLKYGIVDEGEQADYSMHLPRVKQRDPITGNMVNVTFDANIHLPKLWEQTFSGEKYVEQQWLAQLNTITYTNEYDADVFPWNDKLRRGQRDGNTMYIIGHETDPQAEELPRERAQSIGDPVQTYTSEINEFTGKEIGGFYEFGYVHDIFTDDEGNPTGRIEVIYPEQNEGNKGRALGNLLIMWHELDDKIKDMREFAPRVNKQGERDKQYFNELNYKETTLKYYEKQKLSRKKTLEDAGIWKESSDGEQSFQTELKKYDTYDKVIKAYFPEIVIKNYLAKTEAPEFFTKLKQGFPVNIRIPEKGLLSVQQVWNILKYFDFNGVDEFLEGDPFTVDDFATMLADLELLNDDGMVEYYGFKDKMYPKYEY